MAFERMNDDLHIISNLGDIPGADDGISAQELKALFDKASLLLQSFINNKLIPAMENTIPGLYAISMDIVAVVLKHNQWVDNQQTVAVSDVIDDDAKQAVISTASPDSLEAYLDCNIRMVDQLEAGIVFACDDVPESDIVVNLLILTQGG